MEKFEGTIPYETYRAMQAQRAAEEAAANPIDRTVPGGRFANPDGTVVDANGAPLKGAEANPTPAGTHAAFPSAPAATDPGDGARQAAQREADAEAQKTKTQVKSDPRSEDRKA